MDPVKCSMACLLVKNINAEQLNITISCSVEIGACAITAHEAGTKATRILASKTAVAHLKRVF